VSGEHEQADGELRISNEFTSVTVRKVRTRNGEVLEISSAQVDRTVRLDALVLESLTWRSEEDLAKGLETPFGADAAAEPDPNRPEPNGEEPG
jgi:hypothetical protein